MPSDRNAAEGPSRCDLPHAVRRLARGLIALIASCLLLPATVLAQQPAPEPLAAAVELMDQGRFTESLSLLDDMAAAHAGRPWFDRVYGLALLRAGQASYAAMVLQRAVLADPQSAETRLLLARAYLAQGDDEDAERELRLLAASSPPPSAEAQIARMLIGIEGRKEAQETKASARLGLSAGHDSNANAGTDSASYLGFTLAPETRRAESAFVEGRLDAGLGAPITPRWRWSAGTQLHHREYTEFEAATRSDVGAMVGAHYRHRRFALDSALSTGHQWLGGSDSRRQLAWEGGVSVATGSRAVAALRLHAGRLRYAADLDNHDVDQWIGTLQLAVQGTGSVAWQVTAIDGVESAASDGAGFGRSLAGVRLGATIDSGARWQIDAGTLWSDYDQPFFGESRRDWQWNARLGLDWPLQATLASPYATYSRNLSTIGLYTYDRWEIGIAVNWSP